MQCLNNGKNGRFSDNPLLHNGIKRQWEKYTKTFERNVYKHKNHTICIWYFSCKIMANFLMWIYNRQEGWPTPPKIYILKTFGGYTIDVMSLVSKLSELAKNKTIIQEHFLTKSSLNINQGKEKSTTIANTRK